MTDLRPVSVHEREHRHCDFMRDFPLESSHKTPFIHNALIRAVIVVTKCHLGRVTRKQKK